MADDVGRAQDQGRRHRRAGKPSPETSTLLAEYQAAMRAELRTLLADLGGRVPAPGLLDEPGQSPAAVRPALKERIPMWDLAIKLGRELGTEVDPGPAPEVEPAPRSRRRGRIDFG